MTASKCGISRCGLCRFYVHEGRRGGVCSQLDVPVGSRWSACCLAVSPFQSASGESAPLIPASELASKAEAGISGQVSYSSISSSRVSASAGSVKAIAKSKTAAKPKVALTAKHSTETAL